MRRTGNSVLLTALVALATTAAHAHHSGAQFDPRQMVTIEGAVLRFEWANPHVYIIVEQTAEDGKKIEWTVEGAGTGPLRRLGWTQDPQPCNPENARRFSNE